MYRATDWLLPDTMATVAALRGVAEHAECAFGSHHLVPGGDGYIDALLVAQYDLSRDENLLLRTGESLGGAADKAWLSRLVLEAGGVYRAVDAGAAGGVTFEQVGRADTPIQHPDVRAARSVRVRLARRRSRGVSPTRGRRRKRASRKRKRGQRPLADPVLADPRPGDLCLCVCSSCLAMMKRCHGDSTDQVLSAIANIGPPKWALSNMNAQGFLPRELQPLGPGHPTGTTAAEAALCTPLLPQANGE